MNTPFTFTHENHEFTINNTKKVGPRLLGMSENKIFTDGNKHFKNHGNELYEVLDFTIQDNGKLIEKDNYNFDTTIRLGAVILCKNQVLLIHRIKKSDEYYVYPGGHLKTNESVIDGLNREIFEETGIDILGYKRELLYKGNQKGFGHEEYYLIKLDEFPDFMNESNPEDTQDESILGWFDFKLAKSLEKLYPIEIINLI